MDHASSMSTPDLARLLTDAGFRVWPLVRGPAKRPARAGFGRAVSPPPSAAPETFRPDADVAVLMGPCPIAGDAHRLVGVDFDGPVPDEVKARFPATWTTHDGAHLYYFVRADAPYVQTNALLQGELEDGAMWQVDVRDHGGYLAISRDGVPYFDPHDPTEVPITEIDPALLRRPDASPDPLEPAPPTPSAITSRPSSRMLDSWAARFIAGAHQRNDLAGAFGGALARWGYNDAEIETLIRGVLGDFDATKVRKAVDDATRAARDLRAGVANRTGLPRLEALGVVIETEVALQSRLEADEVARLIAAEPEQRLEAVRALGGAVYVGGPRVRPPPPDWVVPALAIAGGQRPSMISGPPKVGKTWFVQGLACAIATGRPFLNWETRGGPVLHVDLEQGESATLERYWQLGLEPDAPLTYVALPDWRLNAQDAVKRMQAAVLATRARWLVIDSMRSATPGMAENSAEEVAYVLAALNEIARDIATTIVHHSSKAGNRGDTHAADAYSGSTAIAGWLSTEIRLSRGENEGDPSVITLPNLSRWPVGYKLADRTPFVIDMQHDGRVALRGELPPEPPEQTLRGRLVSLLTSGPIRGYKSAAEHIGRRADAVRQELQTMAAEGLVNVRPAGKSYIYELA